jgi:hypothetical protein
MCCCEMAPLIDFVRSYIMVAKRSLGHGDVLEYAYLNAHATRTGAHSSVRRERWAKTQLNTKTPAVGTALRYYRRVFEDGEEDEEGVIDIPRGERKESGETDGGAYSKLKTDWKTNPRAKHGRRTDESATSPVHLCAWSGRKTNLPSGPTRTSFGLGREYRR